jgi:hypothetical protein
MGLLDLVFLPVTGPFQGLLFVARNIAAEAERAWFDEEAIRGALLEMELSLQDGQITEQEYAEAEEQLMERLAEAVSRREARGQSRGG